MIIYRISDFVFSREMFMKRNLDVIVKLIDWTMSLQFWLGGCLCRRVRSASFQS